MKKITTISLVGSIFAIFSGFVASIYAFIFAIETLIMIISIDGVLLSIFLPISLFFSGIAFVNLFAGIGALGRKKVTKKFLKIWGILCIVTLVGFVGGILLLLGSNEQEQIQDQEQIQYQEQIRVKEHK